MAKCKQCGKPARFMSDLCSTCTDNPIAAREHETEARIRQNRPFSNEVDDYINKSVGLSSATLNTRAAIGIVVFGWLMKMNYDDLGKKRMGSMFLVAMALVLAIASQVNPQVGILAPIIYVAAWVHTNQILARKQRVAREQYFKENNTVP